MTSSSERPGPEGFDALFGMLPPERGSGASSRLERRMAERGEPPHGAGPRQGPGAGSGAAAGAAGARSPYTRFIPGEELGRYDAWRPGIFGGVPRDEPPVSVAPDPAELKRRAEQAAAEEAARQAAEKAARQAAAEAERQSGLDAAYQDGLRAGKAAAETFRQQFGRESAVRIEALLGALHDRLDQVEQDLAQRVATVALEVARQVVRSELRSHPMQIVDVAQEALSVLLMSARHVGLRIHPSDHAVVAADLADTLAARGVRLISDAQIEPGGCLVESDIGVVDARVATRWARAASALGGGIDWPPPDEPFAAPPSAAAGEPA